MEPVQTGRIFSGRYELTHLIARGGMAQVYRAHDRLLDRPVALKVLFPELSVDRAFVERFRREAQAAANLSHPNIVPVFDWGEADGTYFIVMEFIDGQPLSALLRESGAMTPNHVATIGAAVADALSYAHRHGVVHRDVKPGNVLLTDDGGVKVTDFGIARAINTEESLTQTGAVMGTATYFSPEQAEGIGVDARSDIYSLGVVLFEMVAGRPPFLGETPVSIATKHVREMPPALHDLRPSVPEALELIIVHAMAKNPADRYATAGELREDLNRFLHGRPVVAPPANEPTTTSLTATSVYSAGLYPELDTETVPAVSSAATPIRRGGAPVRRRSRRWVWLLAAVVVIAAVVGIIASKGSGSGRFTMPSYAGETAAQAAQSLVAKGLKLEATQHRASPEPAGTVLGTDPPAGTKVTTGERVTLIVSGGAVTKIRVPTERDQQFSSAVAALQAAGFTVAERLQTSTKPNGTVLSQNPVGTSTVAKGSKVILTVSTQSAVPVPTVVGKSQTQAGSLLGVAGLTVGTTTQSCSASYASGLVASETPAAGQNVAPKSQVNLVISTGPCAAVVPTVKGLTETAAKATLSSKGFTNVAVETTQDCLVSQQGEVVSQTPNGGKSASTTVTVVINVCEPIGSTTTTTKAH